MRRLTLLSALLVGCLFLAGCTGSTPQSTQAPTTAPTTAAPASVTADTGGIEGVVLDEELVPIKDADVGVVETELVTKTDSEGRFSFSELPAGSYGVFAQRLGFESGSRKVEVVAGEIAEAKFTLVALAIVDSYAEPLILDGYILVSNALIGAAEGDTGVVGGCEKCFFNWNASADVVAIIMEVGYTPTLSVPPNMMLYTQVYKGASSGGTIVVNEEWGDRNKEQIENKGASPYFQYLGCGLTSFCYDQRFTEYVTLFHGAEPADDFTGMPPKA